MNSGVYHTDTPISGHGVLAEVGYELARIAERRLADLAEDLQAQPPARPNRETRRRIIHSARKPGDANKIKQYR